MGGRYERSEWAFQDFQCPARLVQGLSFSGKVFADILSERSALH